VDKLFTELADKYPILAFFAAVIAIMLVVFFKIRDGRLNEKIKENREKFKNDLIAMEKVYESKLNSLKNQIEHFAQVYDEQRIILNGLLTTVDNIFEWFTSFKSDIQKIGTIEYQQKKMEDAIEKLFDKLEQIRGELYKIIGSIGNDKDS